MAETIREDEWLAALAEVMRARPDDPGLTVHELGRLWGVSERIARLRLRRLWEAGRIELGRKLIVAVHGLEMPVPCYRLKPVADVPETGTNVPETGTPTGGVT